MVRCVDRLTRVTFGIPFFTNLGILGGDGLRVGPIRARRDAVYIQARPGAAFFRIAHPRELAAPAPQQYEARPFDTDVREPVALDVNLEDRVGRENHRVRFEEGFGGSGAQMHRSSTVHNLTNIGMNAIRNDNYVDRDLPDLGDVSEDLRRIRIEGGSGGAVRYTGHQNHSWTIWS